MTSSPSNPSSRNRSAARNPAAPVPTTATRSRRSARICRSLEDDRKHRAVPDRRLGLLELVRRDVSPVAQLTRDHELEQLRCLRLAGAVPLAAPAVPAQLRPPLLGLFQTPPGL